MSIDYSPNEGEQFTLPLGQNAIIHFSRFTYCGMTSQDLYCLSVGQTYGRFGDGSNDDSKLIFIPVPDKGGPVTLDDLLVNDVMGQNGLERIKPKVEVIKVEPMSITLKYVAKG